MPLSGLCPMEKKSINLAFVLCAMGTKTNNRRERQVSNAGICIKREVPAVCMSLQQKFPLSFFSLCIHSLANIQSKPFKITIPLTSSQDSQDANSQLTHLLIGVGTTPFTCRSRDNDSLIKTAAFFSTLDLLVKQHMLFHWWQSLSL